MQPPLIDTRDMKELIRQMRNITPHYTPEWRFTPEDPDPGTALFMIFASMYQDNIKRLNKVPLKNFIAFLNMFNVTALPAIPAVSYVTFMLSMGAVEPVLVPEGTQVSAVSEQGDQVVFETTANILATPAALVEAYNTSGKKDTILRLPGDFLKNRLAKEGTSKSAVTFYDFSGPGNLQEHCFYLGHNGIFNIKETALIELQLNNSFKHFLEQVSCRKLSSPDKSEWSYWTGERWQAFDGVKTEGNRLELLKTQKLGIQENTINGILSRWIRCKIHNGSLDYFDDVEISGVQAKAEYYEVEQQGGLHPDMLFYNGIQLEQSGFYPVGKHFSLYDSFYFSCEEALTKKGAVVSVKFLLRHIDNILQTESKDINWKMVMKSGDVEEPEPPRVSATTVSWEYWNGEGWVRLFNHKTYEDIFYQPAEMEKTVEFVCPDDLEQVRVNEINGYWIRLRVTGIENNFTPNAVYRSPWMENVAIKYKYSGAYPLPHYFLSYNNLEYKDRLGTGEAFNPFYGLDVSQPAVYMGFDRPPLKGPVSLFFSVNRQTKQDGDPPVILWQYLRRQGIDLEWSELKTIDRTKSFTRSGCVIFTGPLDFTRGTIFGSDLFWIRAVNRDSRFGRENSDLPAPEIKGIYLNTVPVIQQETVENEMFEAVFGTAGASYTLARRPVVTEEVWVNEAGHLTDDEITLIKTDASLAVKEILDGEGSIEEFWVKWTKVEDFTESGAGDRHYVIDRSAAIYGLGDGQRGKMPPANGTENIWVKYKTGGGARGNVRAGEINSLEDSIAFVDSVFNPEPAIGGCDAEKFEDAVRRGPWLLKHRDRAVTAEDFEWLVRQVSQNIAKVKCLPNINRFGIRESGCLTVVIAPKTGAGGELFLQLQQQVEKHLLARAANAVAFPDKIKVIEPVYLEISLYAVLVIDNMDTVALVEQEALDKLNDFLDPVSGNYNKGWEIGHYPHISTFYALLKSINMVHYIEKVAMTVYRLDAGRKTEVNPDKLEDIPHGMVVNGEHKLEIKVS